MTGVDADLATLREAPDSPFGPGDSDRYYAALARVEAELSRLSARRSRYAEARCAACMEALSAAEARCARLQQALAGLESAVRILDVMLREPAAEGLMSAEDYRSYVQGAWLGVDEAAEKAREALAGPDTPADSQEDKT